MRGGLLGNIDSYSPYAIKMSFESVFESKKSSGVASSPFAVLALAARSDFLIKKLAISFVLYDNFDPRAF